MLLTIMIEHGMGRALQGVWASGVFQELSVCNDWVMVYVRWHCHCYHGFADQMLHGWRRLWFILCCMVLAKGLAMALGAAYGTVDR